MHNRSRSNSRDGHSSTHDTREGSSQARIHGATINGTPSPTSCPPFTSLESSSCGWRVLIFLKTKDMIFFLNKLEVNGQWGIVEESLYIEDLGRGVDVAVYK